MFSVLLEQEDEHGITDIDLVAVPYLPLLHRHPVDQRAVGAVQVLEKRVVEHGDHRGVLAADCRERQADVVVGAPADGQPFALERERTGGAVGQVENELGH